MLFVWWAWKELNFRPIGYEPTALTTELQALKWRKERDSNPRYRKRYTPLAGVRVKPLCHLSILGKKNGGETEIRTLGILRYDSFQDCSIRPLWHLSAYSISMNSLYFCYFTFFYGSLDWIRTSDPTINSRLLYHWATKEYTYFYFYSSRKHARFYNFLVQSQFFFMRILMNSFFLAF